MPRAMPPLAAEFAAAVSTALTLSRKAELARAKLTGAANRSLLHPERLELIYEMAFLKAYLAWEDFLEETFIRYVANYHSPIHTPSAVAGAALSSSVGPARISVLHGRSYILWHDPQKVITRSQHFLLRAPHELILQANVANLDLYAKIRHRIAHAQEHARLEFDNASVTLIGHRVHGSKAGRLLRRNHPIVTPPQSWLEVILNDYISMARQIA